MKISEYENKHFLEKYSKTPILHSFVVFPALLRILGNIKNMRILDLGCGSGDFSVAMAKKGANVYGVDISKEWIDICKSKYSNIKNVDFLVADSSNLKKFSKNYFDFVVVNMVFLNISNKNKLKKTFYEISRILKKSGKFIFTDLHPICLMTPKTLAEEQFYLKGFSYFKDGLKYKSKVLLSDNSKIEFVDIHWTLETYTDFLRNAKMYIDKITEPTPIKKSPKIFRNFKTPSHIIFICKKLT
jgi:SAM-dependent methyltransferase